jgi:hypothetical protein
MAKDQDEPKTQDMPEANAAGTDAKIAAFMRGESQGESDTKPAEEAEGGVQDKAGEPKAGSEQDAVAEDAEGQPEPGDDAALDVSDLLDEDGNIDLDKVRKLKKSAVEAQKLVGKTAKDREKLKQLPQIEKEAAWYREFDRLARAEPGIIEAVKRARAKELGMSVPAEVPQPKHEDPAAAAAEAEKKVSELMRQGKYAEASRLMIQSSPEFREFQEDKSRREQERIERQRRETIAAIAKEREEFERKYEGVLYGPVKADGSRDVLDEELFDALYRNVNDHTTYENALAIAAFQLGRSVIKSTKTPAKPDGAKAQALSSGRGTKPAQPSKSEDKEDWFGLNPKSVDQFLKR